MRLSGLRRPQLSYANVTATLALVVATSTGGAYAAATIGSAQIKDDAVKSRHIASSNVKTPDLKDGAVTEGKLADGSVTGGKLGDGSVTEGKLGDGSVTGGKLGDGSVTTGKLGDGSVTTGKLGDGSVTGGKLGSDVVAAKAFGTVMWTGSVPYSRNLTSANVTHPQEGVYCISGLSFAPLMALVSSTLEPNASHHDVEVYGIGGNFASHAPCPAGTQIQIRVYNPGTTTEDDGNFNIAIY